MSKPTWDDTTPLDDAPSWDDTTEIDEQSLLDQLADSPTSVAGSQVARNIPVVGPLAVKAAHGLSAGLARITPDALLPDDAKGKSFGELYDQFEAEDTAKQKDLEKRHPVATTVGSIAGSAAMPVPFAKTAGAAGVAGRIGGGAAIAGADALVRTGDVEDSAKAAGIAGGVSAGLEALPVVGRAAGKLGRKAGNVVFGVPEAATARYLADPKAVKSAGTLKQVSDEFIEAMQEVRSGLSRDSGEAYRILANSPAVPATNFAAPLRQQSAEIEALGAIGPARKKLLKFYESLESDLASMADDAGMIGADKGKALMAVLDGRIQQLKRKGGDAKVVGSLQDARRAIDEQLKTSVPGYAEHMAELAGSTRAAVGIADKFRSDEGAYNTLKQIMRGKSPHKLQDLQKFDERFGTDFAEQLQNSYAKEAFTRETTQGSRKTVAGGAAGAAVGSMVGGPMGATVGSAVGAATGATVDKYGGVIYQRLLDGSLAAGKYTEPLKKVYELRGAAALAAAHEALKAQDPDYRAAVGED